MPIAVIEIGAVLLSFSFSFDFGSVALASIGGSDTFALRLGQYRFSP